MIREKIKIPLHQKEFISAILTAPSGKKRKFNAGVIVAHGAGNDMENALLVAFTDGLAGEGYPTLRFNFPYKEKGLKAPDSQKKLEETWEMVSRFFQNHISLKVDHLLAAGKSMGGRVASQMVAEKRLPVDGLIFLGYPLHPAGDLTKIRDAHLYNIKIPMLFFAGTRDTLCDMSMLHNVLKNLSAPWTLGIIEGGDHSFHIPQSMKIAESEVYDRIVKVAGKWMREILT